MHQLYDIVMCFIDFTQHKFHLSEDNIFEIIPGSETEFKFAFYTLGKIYHNSDLYLFMHAV